MKNYNNTREQNTTAFLTSYEIQEKLREVSGFDEDQDMGTAHPVELQPQNPYDTNLQCGQIRLLSQLDQITYVVLLRRWENDSFVVMTFSHYDFPATDEEFKPDFDGGMYLNVLQAWNTRTLQDEALKKSWLIGNLPASDCSDAWDLWNHILTGYEISPRLVEKTGLPITSPDDIRIKYMREELSAFKQLDDDELLRKNVLDELFNKIVLPNLWENDDIALAAGDEQNDVIVECTPYGYAEAVSIVYSKSEKTLRINIYNQDQSDISKAFDTWELVSENCEVLAVVNDGFCVVRDLDSFDGRCALRNPSDHKIVIFEKR